MKQTPASRRAAEELRAKLADVLLFQISDPRLELVTITDVEVSKDREVADVYVSADKDRYDEVLAGLEAAKGRIRSLVGKKLGWRVTPELRYKIDRSVDAAERIATVLEEEHKWHTVAICGHVNPDGDALGSVLALTCALRSAGYRVTPLLATRERPHLYDFLYAYEDLTPACEYGAVPDVFISVDVPSIQRTGDGVYVFNRACKTIAIDHHQGPADFASVNLVDDGAAAAGMLVWDFIEQAGIERTPDIATCCYTALVTDTGRFQFQNADPDALKAAASMAEAGASPSEISRQVYQRRSMAALKLNSLVIDRMNLICDGRAVISWVREKDFAELGATKDDGESLIDTIRQLDGIEVAVMLREQGPIVRGSIRSKTDRDVAAIAEKMNGGGHKAAAGFTIKGRLENAYDQVVDLLSESFAQTPVARETLDAEVTRTTVFRRIGEER